MTTRPRPESDAASVAARGSCSAALAKSATVARLDVLRSIIFSARLVSIDGSRRRSHCGRPVAGTLSRADAPVPCVRVSFERLEARSVPTQTAMSWACSKWRAHGSLTSALTIESDSAMRRARLRLRHQAQIVTQIWYAALLPKKEQDFNMPAPPPRPRPRRWCERSAESDGDGLRGPE